MGAADTSDVTLQRPRYVPDAVFVKTWTTEQDARDAQSWLADLPHGSTQDASALETFATDMLLEPFRK